MAGGAPAANSCPSRRRPRPPEGEELACLTMTDLVRGYELDTFFDEAFVGDGLVRGHYRELVDRLRRLGPDDLPRRERIRDRTFGTAGITCTVYGDDAGDERTLPMDLVPRVIPAAE